MKIDFSDLIRIPFLTFGRNPKTGLDCYGLAIEVERRYGKVLNDVALEKFDRQKVQQSLPKINVRKTGAIEEACILEFYGKKDRRLHIGIAITKDLFIQATENQGVRISSIKTASQYLTLANVYKVI